MQPHRIPNALNFLLADSLVGVVFKASSQSQRVVSALLHFFPAVSRVLCTQYVRRSGGGELPQVSRKSRARRENETRDSARQEIATQTQEYVFELHMGLNVC